MTLDTGLVFGILAATIALFISDRIRMDLVAVGSMLALTLVGILSPEQALSGFSNPIVLMIAGLFIVGGGLFQTGVADSLGVWLGKIAGASETRLLMVIMIVTAGLSGFMSSTGTVAVMIPVVISLAKNASLSPSKLLIPLSYASLLGGMLTLIGTPPNIVVSDQLREQGLDPFRFFSFTPIGLVMLALGIVYMITFGRRLLPDRGAGAGGRSELGPLQLPTGELVGDYELEDNILRFRISKDAGLAGKTVKEADVRGRFQGTLLAVERDVVPVKTVGPDTVLQDRDLLTIQVSEEHLDEIKRREAALLESSGSIDIPLPKMSVLVEVLLTPRSGLIGRTLKDIRFHDKYRANVLSIKRGGRPVDGNPAEIPLKFGDTLLIEGRRESIEMLRHEHRNFVVITETSNLTDSDYNTKRAPVAVFIMLAMLVLMTFGIVPNVTAVLLAAAAMVLSGCLSGTDAYRSVNMESVVVIAAIVPMATALQNTGGMQLIVDALIESLGSLGPTAVMAGLFIITSLFSQVISNTATTLLIAPMAFQLATALGVSHKAFLVTVAVAASTAFATPIASPTNTLVLNQGQYRFLDFAKIGLPLQLAILVATVLLVPLIF